MAMRSVMIALIVSRAPSSRDALPMLSPKKSLTSNDDIWRRAAIIICSDNSSPVSSARLQQDMPVVHFLEQALVVFDSAWRHDAHQSVFADAGADGMYIWYTHPHDPNHSCLGCF